MSATPRRRSSREKLFKAFYCFSGSEADHGVVRTVAKYKPPSSSVAATVIGTGSSSSSGHSPPTSYEPEQVQDTAVALLCLPDGLQRLHDRPLQGVPQDELFHTFVITQETGHRLFGSALRVWEPIVCSEHIHNPDSNLNLQCYQNKALCLLTAMPLVVASNRILRHIWSNNCSIELIQLICSIPVPITSRFVRVRLPHLGRRRTSSITSTSATDRSNRSDRQGESTVTLSIDQSELFIYGGLSSLPIFDYPLRYLFAHVLQPDQFVRLFAAVLLEQRILITSQRHLPLMLVAESLTNLLRPFAWQHVYVPILPSRLGLHYLDAPTPYIMGIVCPAESESDSDSPGLSIATTDSGSSPIASAHWRFDCDQKKLHVQPQLPNEVDLMLQSIKRQDSNTDFPLSMESDSSIIDEQLSPFLIELQNLIQRTMDEWRPSCSCMPQPDQMWNELNEFHAVSNHSQCDSNTWNTNAVHLKGSADSEHLIEEQRFNHTLRAVMYRHLQRYLLHQHERYIQLARIDTVKFDAVSFLCDQPAADRPFLARFIQTQMFASLIDESGRKLQTQLSAGSGAAACDDSSIFVIVDTDELNECNEINLPSTDSTHLLQSFHEAKLLDLRTLATEPIGSTTTATSSIHNNGTGTITPTIDRIRAHRSHHNHHSQQQHSPFKVCMSPIRSVSKSLQCTSTNKNTMEGKTDAFAAQTHGRVIDSLLKEAKVKTKRIVMDCMRDEKRSPNGNLDLKYNTIA